METISRINVLGVPFCSIDYSQVLRQIHYWHNNSKCGAVSLVNPHSIIMALKDQDMAKAIRQSALVLPDGVGISLASRILGYPLIKRVTGPFLMLKLCEWTQFYGYSHFFYGGAEGVAEDLAVELRKKFPRLKVAGTYCPPFRDLSESEESSVIEYINSCKPDIVWVGLGAPKQEKWINRQLGKIHAAALIGVGAAFDFHSGHKKWAPQWIRMLGIEWAYRLLQEPRRMWRRNINSFIFLGCVFAQRMRLRDIQLPDVSAWQTSTETAVNLYDWPSESAAVDIHSGRETVLSSSRE